MDVRDADAAMAPIAAAIGEPARARMLCALLDGRARTATELAIVARVTSSTASVHLQRLRAQRLVKVSAEGRHRYYALDRPEVAAALESLNVLAGAGPSFVPGTPHRLRGARTCYDHIAGTLGVSLYERFTRDGWLTPSPRANGACELTSAGRDVLDALGVDVEAARAQRRRFAFACLDWSERVPHLGGALAAAVLHVFLRKRWVVQEPDGRALDVTPLGRRELQRRLGISVIRCGSASAGAARHAGHGAMMGSRTGGSNPSPSATHGG
jgi:DNA-binding transcriptional ArsR family regulator